MYILVFMFAFSGIIGHKSVVRVLESSLAKPFPAYLLSGVAHVGKSLIAQQFACGLLELDPSDPLALSAHPDFISLMVEEGKNLVSIEQVRHLKERVSLRPMRAKRNVVFIPQADRFNESGMNALLKVLEEPPADAVFIMVALDASRLPGTIRSRSVQLPLNVVAKQELVDALKARGMYEAEVWQTVEAARGRPGLALQAQTASAFDPLVQDFFQAQNAGGRLAGVEVLAKACESEEDAVGAWRYVLGLMMEYLLKGQFGEKGDFALSIGLLDAWKAVGSAISPRIPLEAGVMQADLVTSNPAGLSGLLPTHLPRSLPMVYTALQDL